ncbi:MAG: hypothetical protein M3R59_09055 [Verrucomicrobiota bacterium]|nr:hypothetical protein [Verrucomicrobiota bacterium]
MKTLACIAARPGRARLRRANEFIPDGSAERRPTAKIGLNKIIATALSLIALSNVRAQSPAPKSPVDSLIPWLLQENAELREIPFSEVIADTTGKRVLAFNPKDETDARVAKQISSALDAVMQKLNAPDSIIQKIPRINEVSSHFEDTMRELLNAAPGFACDFPRTAEGRVQRSGYPDLRLVDQVSQRVYYLDPKLYAVGSRDSSFRTFYFEPKTSTNKVRDDAVHFIVGFEHSRKAATRGWQFTRWDLVDLSRFKVKLKAEFQGSNHDMYRADAIVATSVGRDSVEPTNAPEAAPRSVALPTEKE